MADALAYSIDEAGVGRIRFNRPQIHNAFDNALIESLGAAIEALGADARVRAVVIAAEGVSFCAGGDLAWMLRTNTTSWAAAERLGVTRAYLLELAQRHGIPVIERVRRVNPALALRRFRVEPID